jgi:hypothetical protein
VHESVALPEPVMLDGDRVHDEVLFVARLTTPEKPFRAETVMVEVPAEPALTVTVNGAPVSAKSRTMYVTVREWESDGLVPVTFTWKVEAVLKVQDRVELPEPARVVGETVHDVLLVDRLTVLEKPSRAVTVRFDVAGEPLLTERLVGLAASVKSWTVTVTFAEWDSVPLVPLTVTV